MASAAWVNGWATGDVVTAAEYKKSVGCVFDSTLGVAAASIDTLAIIPSTYAHLRIVFQGRGDTAATLATVLLRFNNDTAANYDYQTLSGAAAAAGASEGFAATSIQAGVVAAASAGAGLAGQTTIDVLNYAGTTFNKEATSLSDVKIGTSTTNITTYRIGGHWRSTAAISRVTVLPSAGNFIAGSRLSVYVWGS